MAHRSRFPEILFAAACLALAVALFVAPPKKPFLPEPLSPTFTENTTDRLNVLFFSHPSDYFLYKGTVIGFQYELLRVMADSLHKELNFTFTTDYEEVIRNLSTSNYDIITYDLKAEDAPGYLVFSEPHSAICPVLLKNTKSTDSTEKVVYLPHNFPCPIIADSLPAAEGWRLVHSDSLNAEELMDLLQDDSIGYAIVDNITAYMLEPFYSRVEAVRQVGGDFQRRWILNPANVAFNQQLSEWLVQYKASPKYEYFRNKYHQPHSHFLMNASPEKKRGRISAYDATIRRLSEARGVDWRLVSAIIYQESHFSPGLHGYGGAYGIMQMMPATAAAYGIDSTSTAAEQLAAGVRMIAYVGRMFKSIADEDERAHFIVASYNSGAGHIFDARALCRKYGGNPDVWMDVVPYLIKKSDSRYYTDPVVKCGYYPGKHTANYTHDVMERYHAYKLSFRK